MACMHKPFDLSDAEDRKHVAAEAIAAQRLEGLQVDPDTRQDFDRFSSGQIDLAQLRENVERRFMKHECSASLDI